MTAIVVEEDRTLVHPAESAPGAPLGLGGALGLGGGGFRSDAEVVILGYD
ncbi:hypothetical protein [Leifsonia shinshuensis]|uniref:Uncharacterized protein n=1 Tax=Leifsonia shinshuensis TaxID=150026 RepID=A0A853CV87_9MICO|nr:hypothetical protein [Leifsonia shinshuensis]NYJ23331.1 hypothetical protein [Leifsonia shinshuensis]